MKDRSDPAVLDQPWRIWASVAVLGLMGAGIILGIVLIPIVQGRSASIDPFTAICRAIGILPGSPAERQIIDRTPPTPVSQVVWTPEVLQILADARPERGRAKVQELCVSCHGEDGVSVTPEFPHLAGQSGAAIFKQLNDYKTGSRMNEIMSEIAKTLDDTTMADLAAYYAGRPKRNPNPLTISPAPDAIIRLVQLGDPKRNIPPCAACHGSGAGGPIETPILSEQRDLYIAAQLKMYASSERRNDVYGRMRMIASQLTESEIQGLAYYYQAGFK